jgi:hypothetical protein
LTALECRLEKFERKKRSMILTADTLDSVTNGVGLKFYLAEWQSVWNGG